MSCQFDSSWDMMFHDFLQNINVQTHIFILLVEEILPPAGIYITRKLKPVKHYQSKAYPTIKVSGCSQDLKKKKTAISPNQKKIHLMHQSPTSRPSYQAAEVSFSIAAMLHDARRHGLQPCLCWCGKAFGLTATSILDVRLAVGGFYWLGWGVSVITCQLYITMFNPQSGFWLCIFFGAAKETGRVWISSIG